MVAATFAVALTVLSLACSQAVGTDGPSGGGGTEEDESPCKLEPEKHLSSDVCKKGLGCGDVMVCQSFCAGCDDRCQVPCRTSADCAAVGAGTCQESAKASNKCSGPPTKCPGAAPPSTGTAAPTPTGSGSVSQATP